MKCETVMKCEVLNIPANVTSTASGLFLQAEQRCS